MKIMLKKILIALPLFSLVFFTGCDDEKEGDFAKPDMVGVTPEIGVIGSEVTITGTGLKNVQQVLFANVPAAGFNAGSNTDNEIKVTVPPGLKDGDVVISVFYKGASDTNLGASDNIPFTVAFAPVLNELEVKSAKPTKSIPVTGMYLSRVTEVLFGETEGSFLESDGVLTVSVPDMPAGEVNMIVKSPGGSATTPFTVLEKTPEIASFTPSAKTGETVTVSGLFFDGATAVLVGSTAVADLNVVSSSEITFKVPQEMTTGKISITTPLGTVESESDLQVLQLIPLPYTIFKEALNTDWEKWGGWGTSAQDLASSEQAKTGTKSIKVAYNDAWGGFQLHPKNPNPFSLEGATKVRLSIYGGPGSEGKKVALYIKKVGGGDPPDSEKKEFTLVEGAWTTFEANFSELGNPPDINEFNFQNRGTNPLTIYIDDIEIL